MAKFVVWNESAPNITSDNKKITVAVAKLAVGSVIGRDGKSAYELAVKNGFEGTEQEWLDSLHSQVSIASVKLSESPNNIITKNPDGLYATIDNPVDILTSIAALDGALNKE